MTCCRSFLGYLFFPFVCSLISLPTGLMPVSSYLPLLRVVFSRETSVIFVLFCPSNNNSYLLRVVLSVQQVSVPLQRVCCSCSLSFPIFLSITFFSTPVVCFAYVIILVYLVHYFINNISRTSAVSSTNFYIFGLACFVVFSYPVRNHFTCSYLDELRLFGLLCFTVCHHRICISLG